MLSLQSAVLCGIAQVPASALCCFSSPSGIWYPAAPHHACSHGFFISGVTALSELDAGIWNCLLYLTDTTLTCHMASCPP